MSPIVVLTLLGAGAFALLSKKSSPASSPAKVPVPTSTGTTVNIPTPAGAVSLKVPPTSTDPSPPVLIPPVQVTLPTLPTDADYPTKPANTSLDPMLDQAEQYALANYSNDQLYNEGMTSGHLAYVAAAATKLAASGDTRAADLTLRVANWGR